MRSCNKLCTVPLIEYFNTVLSKNKASATWTHTPALNFFRVGPHEITHRSFVWNFLLSINSLDLIECVDAGREAAVHAKDGLVDDGGKRKEVHYLCAVAPHVYRPIFAKALIVKAIHLCDLTRLVVASNECDVLRVTHLESKQQQEGLHGVEAPIYEIAHEQIICARTVVAHSEQFHQIVELTMDITANLQNISSKVRS